MPEPKQNLLSDEDLAKSCLDYPQNFEVLVLRHENSLRLFLISRFHLNTADTDDLIQETLIKAHRNLYRFDPNQKWKTWLFSIALHAGLSLLRRPHLESLDDYLAILSSGPGPEFNTDAELASTLIKKALAALEAEDLFYVNLSFVRGLAIEDICTLTGFSANKVRLKIQRASNSLKRAYFLKY